MATGARGIIQAIKKEIMMIDVERIISIKKFLNAIFIPLEQSDKNLHVHIFSAGPKAIVWTLEEIIANTGASKINDKYLYIFR